jgi:hypothetical protein
MQKSKEYELKFARQSKVSLQEQFNACNNAHVVQKGYLKSHSGKIGTEEIVTLKPVTKPVSYYYYKNRNLTLGSQEQSFVRLVTILC